MDGWVDSCNLVVWLVVSCLFACLFDEWLGA